MVIVLLTTVFCAMIQALNTLGNARLELGSLTEKLHDLYAVRCDGDEWGDERIELEVFAHARHQALFAHQSLGRLWYVSRLYS